MFVIGAIAAAIGVPVALVIPWFPANASKQADNVRTLYNVLLVVSVPIFVLVETVVLFSVWKFRMRPGEEQKDGPPIHGNTRLEVVWTAFPAILIVGLCTYAYTVLRSNEKSVRGEMTVNVTERQFAFEFAYPQSGGNAVFSHQLYLVQGQPAVFKLRSLDVIHSFFVPEFSEKLDAVPGITTTVRVTPTRLGNYPAECTELCGAGHSLMRAPVHVVTRPEFQAWLAKQPLQSTPDGFFGSAPAGAPSAPPATTPPSGTPSGATSPAAGKAVFTGTAGCSGCHTLAAAAATGTVGPDLDVRLRTDCSSPASQRVRGATLKQCIFTAITKPYAFLPSGFNAGIMPPTFTQILTQTQIQALVNFLASVAK
jgi:cytochrome c oxidase subunit II